MPRNWNGEDLHLTAQSVAWSRGKRSDPQRWVEDPLESRITQSYHAYSRPTL